MSYGPHRRRAAPGGPGQRSWGRAGSLQAARWHAGSGDGVLAGVMASIIATANPY